MKKSIKFSLLLVLILSTAACEKALEFGRDGGIVDEATILSTKDGITSMLNGAYGLTSNYMDGTFQRLSELMGDNLVDPTGNLDYDEVYRHNVLFFNSTVGNQYAVPYIAILNVNKILENYDAVGFSQAEQDRIKGECLFLRAFSHFELLRLFAHPYGYSPANDHLGIAYKTFSEAKLQPRAPVGDIYDMLIADLKEAESLLPASNGLYATSDAAKALLARIYFQQGDYTNAAAKAGEVISSGTYQLGTELDRFQPNVVLPEVIFYMQSYLDAGNDAWFSSGGFTGGDGYAYRPTLNLTNPLLKPTREFYDLYAGDTTDQRLSLFEVVNEGEETEFIVCTKFNDDYFNVPLLHLTELKLIRAESLAELSQDLGTAVQDINDIRERAHGNSASNLPASAPASNIIEAARYERRIELFGEGNRFHEIKRRGAIEGEPTDSRGDSWDCNGMILQFPISEKSDQFELNPTGGC